MKSIFYLFLLFSCLKVNAQTGIHDPNLASIDTKVKSFMATYTIPGLTFALAKNGKIVYMRAFGTSVLGQTVLAQPHNLYRIASLSKPITSIAIMKLVQEGKVSLSAKVFGPGGILATHPVYSAATVTDTRIFDITVQQLLEHTAGWNSAINCNPNPTPPYPYFFNGCDPISFPLHVAQTLGVPNPVSESNLVRFLMQKGLNFAPGSSYAYSNIGYLVLGSVIEHVTGLSYEQYVKSNLLAPLGIFDMHIGQNLLENKMERESEYQNTEGNNLSVYGTGVMVPWTYGGMNVSAMDAHGGWIATASDLVKLILAIDNFPSKPDILTPATIATMITPSPRNANYAKGWQVNSADNWWHSGSLPGSFSIMARTSGEYAWAIIMNKRFNTGQFANAVDALPWNSIAGVTTWPTYDLALAPKLNATNLSFSEVTSSTMKVSWANGNGANRLLIVRPDAPVNAFPLDGIDYTGVTNFSTAPALPGSTVKVVYSGTGNSATITGLEPGKTYHVRVVEYNKSQSTGNNALYVLGNNPVASQATTAILPVQLLLFEANRVGQKVQLTWATSQEINVSYFEIERSSNATDFSPIGKVNPNGNGISHVSYHYTDDINTLNFPVIYYRLKIVDNDGATTFSKIVSIEYQGSLAFSISPNPATNKIIVRGNNITRVEILNQAGKTIIKKQYLSSPQIQLNISALPSGVYVVKITDRNGNVQNRRVVVQ